MTSVLKSNVTADQSLLVDGTTVDAGDVTVAIDDLVTNDRTGYVSVSAADTNVKDLDDAITVSAGLLKTITSPAADEALNLALATALETFRSSYLDGSGEVALGGLQQGGASSAQVLTWSGSAWGPAAAGGGGATPIDITVTAGENLAERDIVYVDVSAQEAFKLDVDAIGAIKAGRIRGVVNESGGISSAATGTVRISGEVSGFTGLTVWGDVYADTTAGGYTQTKPTVTAGGGQVAIARIGYATSTVAIMVWPSPIEFLKRESLADAASTTIEHYADDLGRSREVSSYVSSSEVGAVLTNYSESNQDDSVWIRGATGAGATTTPDSTAVTLSNLGDASGTDYRLAQSFQVTAGKLTQFTAYFDANNGSPSGDVTWAIHDDDGGIPGDVLQTGTFTVTPSSDNTINIADGIFLSAATTYWLSLEVPLQSTNDRYSPRYTTAGAYGAGELKWDTTVSLPFPDTWVGGGGTNEMRCSITTSAETPRDKLAQGFEISAGSGIGQVRLYLRKIGSPTGNLTVTIEPDAAGDPSGTPVLNGTSDTVAASTLSTSYGYIDFVFSTPPTLNGTTQYHIVLETADSASDTDYVAWGADFSAPSYTDGEMKSEISSSWSAESADAVFIVNDEDTVFEEIAVIGRWGGGTRDVAVRFDDGAGADPTINTTFRNNSGVTLDLTCIVELE